MALVEGRSGVIASGFTVADEGALAEAERELERRGIEVRRLDVAAARSRRVRSGIAFDDPFGNRLELVTQQESLARPVAFGRASGITEFGHLCLDAPDVREAYRFWSGTFNAKVSDWIGDAACLKRIDPVHHKLAVFKGDGPGLCHMNFQVASFGVRRIEDDAAWRPRTFDPAEPGSIDMWLGPTSRPRTQPQARDDLPDGAAPGVPSEDPARVPAMLPASHSG